MNNVKEKQSLLLSLLFGLLAFFPFLGNVHLFDWDEANFAELAREMVLTKNYLQPQINFLPFYEKPPVFIWLQVVSMKLFGISEFAARFPNAVLGILVILTLYWIGKRERNERFGKIWVVTYMGSFLPFMYFRTGLIDPWFNYFMFLSLYFYYNAVGVSSTKILGSKIKDLLASALFLGLAVQTKGPAAFIIVYGTIGLLWVFARFKSFPGIINAVVWALSSLFFSSLWFLYETYQHGTGYMYEFIIYQIRLFTTEDALHGGPIYYHFIVLLFGCFPASFILLFTSKWKEDLQNDWTKIMCICGVLVLVLFSIVQTKIIHYSSMAYFPISYMAAITLEKQGIKNNNLLIGMLSFFIITIAISIALLPLFGKNLSILFHYIDDPQTRFQLNVKVDWHYYEAIFGILILSFFVYLRINSKNLYQPFFYITSIIVLTLLIVFAPKIEKYVQGELISFYSSKKKQNIDIKTLYIKSYACYFYADKQPYKNDTSKDHLYYLYDKIERDVYFVLRTKDIHNMDTTVMKDVHKIKEANGFSYYLRSKTK